ncbi:glycoside hydrolase family 18 protein [Stenotrophomonas sp. SY1]|uniref:glycoside hydrolase family 18 protein n=1 Tax=Stenotrophomonas sp. SY1 TaxID=477235 RepID=UPI001E634041|nr:glycoside hydrolase family 18 protein [Stenotrophomonas sp. SY1]MCD9088506.1 glycoside hydrolase family 18 protein [Stenotrophomonas sp. SY1]
MPALLRRPRLRALLAITLLGLATLAHARTPRVIGYVMDGPAPLQLTAEKLDVVNFAFAVVRPDGSVYLPDNVDPARLHALVGKRADNPSLQIVLSIGGWGAGNFSEAAASDAARTRFIDSSVALMHQFKLDGLDIDWEYPTLGDADISHSPDDRQNFTVLLEQLRARLDAEGQGKRHYLLTIAAAEGRAAAGLELPRIAKSLDWINLMTYDFYGSLTKTTGHHAGLSASPLATVEGRTTEGAVKYFLDAGVPAEKINVGVPFYGRTFGDVGSANQGRFQKFSSEGGFISWRDIVHTRLNNPDWEQHWDEQAQVPWLWNPKERRMVSYEDPRSLALKAEYVKRNGLGGIMYWEQRQDDNEQLLDVLHKALHDAQR